jgi:hypothetical protein
MSDIDPVQYGKLIQKVEDNSARLESVEKKVTAMYEMMVQAKGGWKTFLVVGTVAGAIAGFLLKLFGFANGKPL